MKKILSILMIAVLFVGVLAGCTSTTPETPVSETSAPETSAPESGGNLIIYSPNSEDMVNAIIPLFEAETGIKVELISMGTGEVFKRIESEAGSPAADLAWGGGRATYYNNLDFFQEYTSANNDNVMDEYKNDTDKVTLYCLDGSCLLVNKDLIGDIKVTGYKDLLNPELKGKISGGDPANSSSAFAQLTNQLLAMGGDYESEAGWEYVRALTENMEAKIASGSQAVHKSVADGEYTVAITYEDPAASYIKSGVENLEVVYPEEGSVYLPAGSGIIKGAKNLENAKLFMDFIVSKSAQDAFGTELTVRPVSADAKLGDYMTPLSEIVLLYEDYDYVAENKTAMVDKYIEVLTSVE